MKECRAYNLGLVGYEKALRLQDRLVRDRIADDIPDTILLLQHPPVITFGRSGSEDNILVPPELLTSEGISVRHIDRGGDITLHSPGQLVVYPILDLKPLKTGLHRYVRNLEETIIRTLRSFSIAADRDPRYPGVWSDNKKICALGIRVRRWVTKHGFSLNVDNDLRYFSYINSCGIRNRQITSMTAILETPVSFADVMQQTLEQFSRVFGMKVSLDSVAELYSHVD
jgi:lipoate-protein ligase B